MRMINEHLIALETLEELQALEIGVRVEDINDGYWYIVEAEGLREYCEGEESDFLNWATIEEQEDCISGSFYLGRFAD